MLLRSFVLPGKKRGLFIIFILFCSFVLFLTGFPLQGHAQALLHSGATAYLDIRTRDYNQLESEHFRLKYTGKDCSIASSILDMAEEYYQKTQETLNYFPEKSRPLVVIFPEQELLDRSINGSADKSAAGIYWAGSIRLLSPRAWMPDGAEAEETLRVYRREGPLSHELTHYLVDLRTKGNYTRWLSEGLAQYVERETTGFVLPEPDFREGAPRCYAFDRLERDYDTLPDQILVYWQSLQAVSHLIDAHGWEKMRGLLDALGQGRAFGKAFQETYGYTVDDLETKVNYIMQKKNLF